MKWNWLAALSALVIGFATLSPSLMAQSAAVAASTESLPADPGATPPAESVLSPAPVAAYTPPTEGEKLQLFALQGFGPLAMLQATVGGGIQQATKSPPEWGSHWRGYGLRVASNFGVDLVTAATHYGLAEISHEDIAYYTCQCKGLLPRLRHAVLSTFTGRRGADGHTVFSFAAVAAPYAGAMTALAWYPHRYSVKDGFRMGNYNLADQAGGNLLLEFIYGGPHTLLGHLHHSKPPEETAELR
jgi:hypothetical protein